MILKGKNKRKGTSDRQSKESKNDDLKEYPSYPESEDIYSKYLEEDDLNPEDTSRVKDSDSKRRSRKSNESGFEDDMSGSDLDIPGSELDDEQEFIGLEDEENNYYSLGDDDHNYLDENEEEF
jgi:hypothetical protein